MRRILCTAMLVSVCVSVCFLCACGDMRYELYTYTSFDYFDTVTVIKGYASSRTEFDSVISELENMLAEYDSLFDIYDTGGTVNLKTVNDNAGKSAVTVSPDIIELLEYSKELEELCGGKFNICMGSVISIWHSYMERADESRISDGIPDISELSEAAEHMSSDSLIIDRERNTVFISDEKTSLDVGGIAKGYAAEKAAEYLESRGIKGYILNLGGNLRAVGARADGSPWNVGIEDPDEHEYGISTELCDMSLVTSGSYQRYFIFDGKRYHHIIDPVTLFPKDDFLSVTVMCKNSAFADAVSTAIFNMSIEEGTALIESIEGAEALWICSDGSVLKSSRF